MNTYQICILLLVGSTLSLDINAVNLVSFPYSRLSYSDPRAALALEQVKNTGANYVNIPVTFFQDFKNSTYSYNAANPFITESGVNETPSEKDITHIITKANELGLKVILQFHALINQPNWPDSRIIGDDFAPKNAEWWVKRYTENAMPYVKIAAKLGVDTISLGHNFFTVGHYEFDWKKMAARIREEFKGKLTYSAASGDEDRQTGFWEALDYVGVFPKFKATTTDGLKQEVTEFVRVLTYMNKLWKLPVIVTRVAACNLYGGISQSDLFRTVYDNVKGLSFVKGIVFGDWIADILYKEDESFNVQGTKAEEVLTGLFGGKGLKVNKPQGTLDYTMNCPCGKMTASRS
jgi:hypothetical protein